MSIHLVNKIQHKLYDWLYDISDTIVDHDLQKALISLRAVLQALRDNLPMEHIAHFGDQLPTAVRGLYYENWKFTGIKKHGRKSEDFFHLVSNNLSNHKDIDSEMATIAVLRTLITKIDPNEIEKLTKVLPKGVREIIEQRIMNYLLAEID